MAFINGIISCRVFVHAAAAADTKLNGIIATHGRGICEMAKKNPTAAERRHMEKVRALACLIGDKHCGGRVEVHHITGAGMALRASHYETIPLCTFHHSEQTPLPFGYSVHKGTKSFEKRYGTQQELLEKVRRLLSYEFPN